MVVCFFELFDGVSFATDGHVWAENGLLRIASAGLSSES